MSSGKNKAPESAKKKRPIRKNGATAKPVKSETTQKPAKKGQTAGPAKNGAAKKPAKSGMAQKPAKNMTAGKSAKGKATGKPVKSKAASKPAASETMKAYERQKKLEDTMPLGSAISQFTSDLPILNKNLDAPDRRPWKDLKLPKLKMSRSWGIRLAVVGGIIGVLAIAAVITAHVFTVKNVTIEGNTHYSNEEIYDMVLGGRFGHNSLYLTSKYKGKDIEGIPFIQTMNVDILNPSSIKITVYEKAMAGYVEYMGRYFYFDKDGTVVESSDIRTDGIPQVMGLKFDHIVLYEKLPVESDEIFKQILEMTQLLAKYDIEMDKMYFDANYDMTLYFGDARIKIGDFDNIDEKIIRLKDILPELEGRKGVLRLDNYGGGTGSSIITFEVDEE